jgi:hypothetical protein
MNTVEMNLINESAEILIKNYAAFRMLVEHRPDSDIQVEIHKTQESLRKLQEHVSDKYLKVKIKRILSGELPNGGVK